MTEPNAPVSPELPNEPMRAEIATLRQKIREIKSLQNSGRWWVIGTTVIVVVLFAAFSWGTYEHIKDNFNHKAVQQAMSTYGASLIPMAQRMITATGKAVMPSYQDAIVATMRKRGPTAAKAALTDLRNVSQKTGKLFQTKMHKAFEQAVAEIQPDFKKAFPNMPDKQRQAMLQSFAADQIGSQNKQIATQISQLYTNDLIHTQAALQTLNVPQVSKAPGGRDAMEKKFLHTMIALLDLQVDDAFAKPSTQPAQTTDTQVAPLAANRPVTK